MAQKDETKDTELCLSKTSIRFKKQQQHVYLLGRGLREEGIREPTDLYHREIEKNIFKRKQQQQAFI